MSGKMIRDVKKTEIGFDRNVAELSEAEVGSLLPVWRGSVRDVKHVHVRLLERLRARATK